MVTTNIETVKISELPSTTQTANMQVPATNKTTNQSMAVDLTGVDAAIVNANNAANAAGAAAARANTAAEAADDKRISIEADLAGKADLDSEKRYVKALQINPLSGYQSGVIMGKGSFRSFAAGVLPTGDWGAAILLTTPDDVTTKGCFFFNHTEGLNTQLLIDEKYLHLLWSGRAYAKMAVQANKLYCVVLGYDREANQPALYVNGNRVNNLISIGAPVVTPDIFQLGASLTENPFAGKIHSCRLFNFDPSEYVSEIWNGGHPELWKVPDVYRNIQRTLWPTASHTPSQGTWRANALSMTTQTNVGTSNGFSGPFQRWTDGTERRVSVYNEWRLSNKATDLNRYQFIEFEYRCDAPLRAAMGTNKVYGVWEANTGNAKKASYIAPAGEYTNLDLGTSGTFLEVRTLRIVTLGCILDLVPEGLLGNVWRDISGQSMYIPYVPLKGNPDTVEFSYNNVGYRDTVTGEAAPVVAPDFIGQTYIDTVNKNVYKAVGTVAAADWKNV